MAIRNSGNSWAVAGVAVVRVEREAVVRAAVLM
jgi:hypothetical protein